MAEPAAVLGVVVLGAIGVMQLAVTPSTIGLAYPVKAGELMVEQCAVLRTDVLAWPSAGRPWADQNWGAQALLYAIWRTGGFALLAVTNARSGPWPPGSLWRRPAGAGRPSSAWSRRRCSPPIRRRRPPSRPGADVPGAVRGRGLPARGCLGRVPMSLWRFRCSCSCERICMAPSPSDLGLLAIEAIVAAWRRIGRACSASSPWGCSAWSGCWPIRGAPGRSPMPRGCLPTGSSPGCDRVGARNDA